MQKCEVSNKFQYVGIVIMAVGCGYRSEWLPQWKAGGKDLVKAVVLSCNVQRS